jgi:hypothetical protein
MSDYDEDGEIIPPAAPPEAIAYQPGKDEVIVTSIACRRIPEGACTARGHPAALLRVYANSTAGPFVFYLTRDEAAGLANGMTALLCDG